jgi:putative tryptophan/tyrosine transport system substrate-binding protein
MILGSGVSAMKRRDFMALLGGAAAWPLAARAQQGGKIWRIGWLSGSSPESASVLVSAFLQGMRELGYAEGRDFVIEARFADGQYERFPDFAAEFVRLNVDLIIVAATAAIRAVQRATTTIPIVLGYSTDPVGNGFVASLARPGGNITGLSSSSDDSTPKQLELVAAVVPNVSRVGLLGNPASTTYGDVRRSAQNAAKRVGLALVSEARDPSEIEMAFAQFEKEGVQAFISAGDALFFRQQRQIAELALRSRLPSMFSQREYVQAGGADELWRESVRVLPPICVFRGQDFQRGKAQRPADRATHAFQSRD